MKKQSDEALLKEFLRGNDQAFTKFIQRYQDVIYRLALKNLNNEDIAREAAQEVFVRAWQKLKNWRFGLGGKPFSWLYRTMLNVCSEMRKKHRREIKKRCYRSWFERIKRNPSAQGKNYPLPGRACRFFAGSPAGNCSFTHL